MIDRPAGPRTRHAGRPRRGPLATFVGVIGELLITAGVLILLYVAYTLWGTGLATHQAQGELLHETIGAWDSPDSTTGQGPANPAGDQSRPQEADPTPGEGLAVLRIPRLGSEWEWAVVEGVDPANLTRGPGHYPGTALPGQVGNFAIAGHRSGHGEPFAQFDKLRPGDEVIVETRVGTYSYRIDDSQIVRPEDTWVIEPVPGQPGQQPTDAKITLTTCHPRWGSTERLIVFGSLVDATQRGGG